MTGTDEPAKSDTCLQFSTLPEAPVCLETAIWTICVYACIYVCIYVSVCIAFVGVPTETKDQKVGVSELIDEVAEGRILIFQNGSKYT